MNRPISLVVLAAVLLLIPLHRLPAPIVEETTPQPGTAPKRKVQSKSLSTTKSAPGAESGMSSKSVQVVLTDNTRAAILYLKNYEGKPFSNVRTGEILEQLRQALSTRFSNVSISESNSTSRSGGLT